MKRILLISNNIFSTVDNNGKTYASILSHYLPSSVAQLYFSIGSFENRELCSTYFNITDIDVCRSILKQNTATVRVHNFPSGSNSKNNFIRNKSVGKIKKLLTPFLRDVIWKFGRWYSPALKKWLKEFAPDVVFLVSGPYNFPNNIAKRICEDFQIPLVLYYTDDYVVNSIKHNIFYPIVKYRRNKFYKNIISYSSKRYVIGEEMADVYSKYFDKRFDYIMNSVDIIPYSPKNFLNDNAIISYFGSLHSKRWNSIIKLSKSLPDNCIINVYTISIEDSIKKEILKHSRIRLHGGIRGAELLQAMYNSDFLLHVESDDKYYRRLTGLSVSTKIPEYLIASRPIIAFGPQEVASMKLLSNNKIGIPIDSATDEENIRLLLNDVISKPQQLLEMTKRGYDFALRNFNRKVVSEKVFKDLENL